MSMMINLFESFLKLKKKLILKQIIYINARVIYIEVEEIGEMDERDSGV